MTTTAALIAQTRNYMMSSRRDNTNQLASSYTAGGATLAFAYDLVGLSPGAVIAVDLEVFLVMAVNPGAKTATVLGAQQGSTAANHASATAAYVNPEFTDYAIFREINNDLDDLSAPTNGLFQVKEVTLTSNAATQGYDLAADVMRVLEVRYKDFGPGKQWPTLPSRSYALKRDSDTTVFPTGTALVLYRGTNPGLPIRVSYAAPFSHLATVTDDVTAVSGLSTTADDLPTLGAAMRLVGIQEAKRTLTGSQGDTRRASEVPAGAVIGAARWLGTERARRIAAESSRLERAYPNKRRLR